MTDVIAHRGASALERENTVAAFRRAVELGADGIELDVRTSADGVLVVHHDAVLADGRPVCDIAAADLPEHIPTLSEALDACAGVTVNLELKNDPSEPDFDPTDGVADAVAALLADRPEPPECWLISSFRRETIDRFVSLQPETTTAFLTMSGSPASLGELVQRAHVAVHPGVETVTPEFVEVARRLGLRVNVWTCNDGDRAQELAGWGVDGIVTDAPDVILRALGRPTPA